MTIKQMQFVLLAANVDLARLRHSVSFARFESKLNSYKNA